MNLMPVTYIISAFDWNMTLVVCTETGSAHFSPGL